MDNKFEDLYTLHIRRTLEPYSDEHKWDVLLANREGKVKASLERHLYSFRETSFRIHPHGVTTAMCLYFGEKFYPENYKKEEHEADK